MSLPSAWVGGTPPPPFACSILLPPLCLLLPPFACSAARASSLQVRHGPTGAFSNAVGLDKMLMAVMEWMTRDERSALEDSVERLRLPLLFSLENNHSTDRGEAEMAAMFARVFGARLVRPAELSVGVTLRKLSAPMRRILIKSSSWKGAEMATREWAECVAMWKPAAHPLDERALVCKSVEAPSAELAAQRMLKGLGSGLRRMASQGRISLTGVVEQAEASFVKAEASLVSATWGAQKGDSSESSTSGHTGTVTTDQYDAVSSAPSSSSPSCPPRRPSTDAQQHAAAAGAAADTSEDLPTKSPPESPSAPSRANVSSSGDASPSLCVSSSKSSVLSKVALPDRVAPPTRSNSRRPSQLTRHDTDMLDTQDVWLDVSHQGGTAQDHLTRTLAHRVRVAVGKANEKRAKMGLAEVCCSKVSPPASHQLSENYDPTGAFDARTTLTALNMQGRAKSGRSRLSLGVMRGGKAPAADGCVRDRVRSLEAVFTKHGEATHRLPATPTCHTWLLYLSAIPVCYTWLLYLAAPPGCSTWLLHLPALPGCYTWLLYLAAPPVCSTWLLYLAAAPACLVDGHLPCLTSPPPPARAHACCRI